jgi:hypothetical protein
MNSNYTYHDLKFINWLKSTLRALECFIVKDNDKKHYEWVKKEAEHPLYDGINYKEEMVDCFIEDLTNGTQHYIYDFFRPEENSIEEIITRLSSKDSFLRQELKLNVLNLLGTPEELLLFMLHKADEYQDSDFMLKLLNQYHHQSSIRSSFFNDILCFHRFLIEFNQIDINVIRESLIRCFKHSVIHHEIYLISSYQEVFKNEGLDELLKEFNIEPEGLCLGVKPNIYSQMSLSLKTLIQAQLSKVMAMYIPSVLDRANLNFPKFFYQNETKTEFNILFEQGEYNEKKIIMLLELLIENKYDYVSDSSSNHKILFNFIEQINEKFYLDNIIGQDNSDFVVNQKQKNKI